MPNKFYLVEMPEGWTPGRCEVCPHGCKNEFDIPACTHAGAREAVEVQGGISRAIATQFDKEVKLFAVEGRHEK